MPNKQAIDQTLSGYTTNNFNSWKIKQRLTDRKMHSKICVPRLHTSHGDPIVRQSSLKDEAPFIAIRSRLATNIAGT